MNNIHLTSIPTHTSRNKFTTPQLRYPLLSALLLVALTNAPQVCAANAPLSSWSGTANADLILSAPEGQAAIQTNYKVQSPFIIDMGGHSVLIDASLGSGIHNGNYSDYGTDFVINNANSVVISGSENNFSHFGVYAWSNTTINTNELIVSNLSSGIQVNSNAALNVSGKTTITGNIGYQAVGLVGYAKEANFQGGLTIHDINFQPGASINLVDVTNGNQVLNSAFIVIDNVNVSRLQQVSDGAVRTVNAISLVGDGTVLSANGYASNDANAGSIIVQSIHGDTPKVLGGIAMSGTEMYADRVKVDDIRNTQDAYGINANIIFVSQSYDDATKESAPIKEILTSNIVSEKANAVGQTWELTNLFLAEKLTVDHVTAAAGSALGIRTAGAGITASDTQTTDLSVTNITGHDSAIGLENTWASFRGNRFSQTLNLGKATIRNITATNGSAYGLSNFEDMLDMNTGEPVLQVSDSLIIENVQGKTEAYGLYNREATKTSIAAPSQIAGIKSTEGTAYGVWSDGMKFENGLSVRDVKGQTSVGVQALGTVAVDKGVDIAPAFQNAEALSYKSAAENCFAIRLTSSENAPAQMTASKAVHSIAGTILADGAKGLVDIQGSDGTKIYSDILAKNGANINIALEGTNSLLEANIDDSSEAHLTNTAHSEKGNTASPATTNISLDHNARWLTHGKNRLTTATIGANGGTIDLTKTVGGSVTIGTLAGESATFRMNLSSDASQSDMLYIGALPAGKTHTVEVVLPENTVGAISELVDAKTRFATTKGDYFTSGAAKELGLTITNQGILDWKLQASTEQYSTSDANNTKFNGTGLGENSNKPGADAVDAWIGTDTATNWFVSGSTAPDPTLPEEPSKPGTNPSDAGHSLLFLAHSNYWNAVEMDRLHKRMGDTRYGAGDSGLWVRVRHDSIGMNSGKGDFNQTRTMSQLGYDHALKANNGRELIGLALDYWESDTDFEGIAGQGGTDRFGLTAYGTWLGNSGAYVDVTAKWAILSNNFNIINSSGNTVSADYDNHAYSLGIESGHKFSPLEDKSWFIEPEVQLQYTYATGAQYRTSQGSRLEQNSFHSVVSRVGLRLGRTSSENPNTSLYFKADWLREWHGKQDIKAFDATTAKNGTDLSIDNKGNWFDVGLGYQAAVSDMTYVYVDGEYSFGNDLVNTWNINAGVRWTF